MSKSSSFCFCRARSCMHAAVAGLVRQQPCIAPRFNIAAYPESRQCGQIVRGGRDQRISPDIRQVCGTGHRGLVRSTGGGS